MQHLRYLLERIPLRFKEKGTDAPVRGAGIPLLRLVEQVAEFETAEGVRTVPVNDMEVSKDSSSTRISFPAAFAALVQ